MIIEDYSPVGFDRLGDAKEDGDREGKFVHIVGPQEEYLVFAAYRSVKWHAQIVLEFCRRHDDASCTSRHGDEDARFDIPGWRVDGGGHYRLNRQARTLELGGSSKAYGRYNSVTLPGKIHAVKGWAEFKISAR